VRAAIEVIVSSETQLLEDTLLGRLDGIIRSAQDRVFANYRSSVADSVADFRGTIGHQDVDAELVGAPVALQPGDSYDSRLIASPAVEYVANPIQPQLGHAPSGPSISSHLSSTMVDLVRSSVSHAPDEANFDDFIHVPRPPNVSGTMGGEATQSELEWMDADGTYFCPGDVELDNSYTGNFHEYDFSNLGGSVPPQPL